MPLLLKLLRRAKRVTYCDEFDPDAGGGIAAAPSPAPAPADSAPAASAPTGPASMLEAIEQGMGGAEPAAAPAPGAQPRDAHGRFTFKDAAGNAVDAQGNPDPTGAKAADGAQMAAQPTPAADEDPLKMPEGLGPKAQDRFQKLANTNRELTEKLDMAARQVEYVQQTFQENGVKQEQFEQAVGIIGMMNRGDLVGAQRMLQQQLQQLAVLTGQSVAVDPLADFPELRQKVDSLLMSEQDALAHARLLMQQQASQQVARQQQEQQTRQHEQQQAQRAAQESRTKALNDVDAFCKQMQGSDLDYSAIESKLLPAIPELLQGVPPERWAAVVKTQYQLLKSVAGGARPPAPGGGGQVLRPTGQASPSAQPKSMYDAMWSR